MSGSNKRERLPYFEEAATFFLDSAFRHIDDAFYHERCREIFTRKISGIELPDDWVLNEVPESIETQLECSEDFFPEGKIDRLTNAWDDAKEEAYDSEIRFPRSHVLNSIEVIGHVINLSACVEAGLNRYLHDLNQTGKIPGEVYDSLDRADILVKYYFALRDEVASGKVNVGSLKVLIRWRNKAVHFKAESRDGLRPSINDLLNVWTDVGKLLKLLDGEPTIGMVTEFRNYIVESYVESRKKRRSA